MGILYGMLGILPSIVLMNAWVCLANRIFPMATESKPSSGDDKEKNQAGEPFIKIHLSTVLVLLVAVGILLLIWFKIVHLIDEYLYNSIGSYNSFGQFSFFCIRSDPGLSFCSPALHLARLRMADSKQGAQKRQRTAVIVLRELCNATSALPRLFGHRQG
jgi:hypothetical protein